MNIGSFIALQRKRLNLTQEELARRLGISRPTLVSVEKGVRDITATELVRLAQEFGISVDSLLSAKYEKEAVVTLQKHTDKRVSKDGTLRISVPQKKLDIFKEILLYILAQVGSKPNVGETVIYKLLYFIDFDYYEKFEKQLIGATYIKNHFGPTPIEFKKVVDVLEKEGALERVTSKFFTYEQRKYLPLRTPDLSKLSGNDLRHIDEVLSRLSDKTAKELTEYSHKDIPWATAEDGKPIAYEAVFYRSDPFSVRTYESL